MKYSVKVAVFCVVVLGGMMAFLFRQRMLQPAASDESGKIPVIPVSAPSPLSVKPDRTNRTNGAVSAPAPEDIIRENSHPFNVSKPVATILGLDNTKKDYKSRVKALRELTRDLPENDKLALLRFLDAKSGAQKDMRPLEFNGLKNDVLDVLLRQNQVPSGIAKQLVSMYRDAAHDDVWRDYCVQYMSACYEATKPTGVASNAPDMTRKEIETAYWDAAKETDKTIAGTSLLALEQLSRTYPEFDRAKVSNAALEAVANDRCAEAPRITALRICALTGAKDVLPSARILAQTGETIPLRMAAVATVGDLGSQADVELLKSMAADSEKRISNIASSAVTRLTLRLAKNTNQ
ncbi:MAG: hypothetical protein ACOYOU_14580 [Kiritimatiellia bacterium]